MTLTDRIVQRVAELPDRTSPDDWPEALLVTADELRQIVTEALASEKTDKYYRGETGTRSQWWQCRFCNGYAEGAPGHVERRHVGECPVAALEAVLAAEPAPEQARHDADALIARLSDLLTRTANALHGGPHPTGLWSWHDLPELATTLRGFPDDNRTEETDEEEDEAPHPPDCLCDACTCPGCGERAHAGRRARHRP